jgi:hypothetical protein
MSWGRLLIASLSLSALGCLHGPPPELPSGCEAPPPPRPPQGDDRHPRLDQRLGQPRPLSEARKLALETALVLGDPFPSTPRYQLAVDQTQRQYKLRISDRCIGAGYLYAAVLRICVSAEGTVSSVDVLRRSVPAVDDQFPRVIGRWRYLPYLEDGVPTPFCYVRDYRLEVSERTGWLF